MGNFTKYKRLSIRELNEKYKNKKPGEVGRVSRYIDGKSSKGRTVAAYCWNINHMGYLTEEMILKHQCKEKSCSLFQEYGNKQ